MRRIMADEVLDDLALLVCRYRGVTPEELRGRSTMDHILRARNIFVGVAIDEHKLERKVVADYLGRELHTIYRLLETWGLMDRERIFHDLKRGVAVPRPMEALHCGLAILGVELADVMSDKRSPEIVRARELTVGFMRDQLHLSFACISECLGYRTHSSVHTQFQRYKQRPDEEKAEWCQSVWSSWKRKSGCAPELASALLSIPEVPSNFVAFPAPWHKDYESTVAALKA